MPSDATSDARPRAALEPMLEECQNRLDAAAARGAAAYERELDRLPAGVGVHEIDQDKVCRRVSRGALELLRYSAPQLLGRRVTEIIVMRDTSDRAIERKLAGAELRPFVRTFIRGDGTSVTLLLVDRHLKADGGELTGLRTVYAPVDLGA